MSNQPGMRLDGLLLGGQVHNSSSSSTEAIDRSFAALAAIGGNTVLAPVSWAQFEPAEGRFDTRLVDAMLEAASAHGLRLVPLWFGAFKNAASTYAPSWVRADRQRFPRARADGSIRPVFTYEGATAKPNLSVFSPDLVAADGTAFEAFAGRLAEADERGCVAMVQVENETGLLGDSRDRSDIAEATWRQPVPAQLLSAVAGFEPNSLTRRLWESHGAATSGDWATVFGDDADAHEVFMAWGFASYVGSLARRGRVAFDVPMYANAWLGPQPGQDRPGQYPSGGPASRVIDLWRAMAPALSLVAPDIYVESTRDVMSTYAAAQPFFVPECRVSAAELVRAVGVHRAVGWSVFGVDDVRPGGQVATTVSMLLALEAAVLSAQAEGRIGAVILEPGEEVAQLDVGGVALQARSTAELFRKMLLDVGVRAPVETVSPPDETLPGAAVPAPGESRPFALVMLEPADDSDRPSLVVIGSGVTVDFVATDPEPNPGGDSGGGVWPTEIDAVEELLLRDGELVVGRVLNGDERLSVLPTDRVGAARIRLLRARS